MNGGNIGVDSHEPPLRAYKNWISGNRLGWAGSFDSPTVSKDDTTPDAKPVESDMTSKSSFHWRYSRL